jgi:cell division protein FtsZ
MVELEPWSAGELRPRIIVIGIGGAGGNAVVNLSAGEVDGVRLVVANTDAQALTKAYPAYPIQLGARITGGMGAGAAVAIGKSAAEESIESINRALDDCRMCFIAAGLGGGTGTGAAPVVAKAARDKGILTIGVVTTPFGFEGTRRARVAQEGIEELRRHVDTLIVIPNQNLIRLGDRDTSFKEAFRMGDDILQQAVRGITDLIIVPGLVNLDFADIRSVMGSMGQAMIGIGEAVGANRAVEAAQLAVSNPLLDCSVKGATGLLISILGGEDLRLLEIEEVANFFGELVGPQSNTVWGSAHDPEMQGRIRVSVVVTGLDMPASAFPDLPEFALPSRSAHRLGIQSPLQVQAAGATKPMLLGVRQAIPPSPLPTIGEIQEELLLNGGRRRPLIRRGMPPGSLSLVGRLASMTRRAA